MNRKSLIATIKSNCSSLLKDGQCSDGLPCTYVEVFEDPDKSRYIGISSNGFWCSIDSGRIIEIKEIDHRRILFRLLENPLDKIIELIKQGLKTKKLPNPAIITFPFDELIISALQSSWSDLAKQWIAEGYPINDEIRMVLCNNDKQSKLWINSQRERFSDVFGI